MSPVSTVREFPLTLEVLRTRANMTQKELAFILGRSQPEISLFENGTYPLSSTLAEEIIKILRDRGVLEGLDLESEDLQKPWDEIVKKTRE